MAAAPIRGSSSSSDGSSPLMPVQSRATSMVWGSMRYGAALESYQEEHIVPGEPLSVAVVKRLFARLSSINLCPCRDQDVAVKGSRSVVEGALQFVSADLSHHKEHAALRSLSMRWDAEGRPSSRLLRSKEAGVWGRWMAKAKEQGLEPRPTRLQGEFVAASEARAGRKRRWSKVFVVAALALLAVAVATGAMMAVTMWRSASTAREAEQMAQMRAVQAEIEAMRTTKEVLIMSSGALISSHLDSGGGHRCSPSCGFPLLQSLAPLPLLCLLLGNPLLLLLLPVSHSLTHPYFPCPAPPLSPLVSLLLLFPSSSPPLPLSLPVSSPVSLCLPLLLLPPPTCLQFTHSLFPCPSPLLSPLHLPPCPPSPFFPHPPVVPSRFLLMSPLFFPFLSPQPPPPSLSLSHQPPLLIRSSFSSLPSPLRSAPSPPSLSPGHTNAHTRT